MDILKIIIDSFLEALFEIIADFIIQLLFGPIQA